MIGGWSDVPGCRTFVPMSAPSTGSVHLTAADVDVRELAELIDTTTDPAKYPYSSSVDGEIVTYDMAELGHLQADPATRTALATEIAHALEFGPGIVAMRGAVDVDAVQRATQAFEEMIARELASGQAAGDHFAEAGANNRVWNALEKLALLDPVTFIDYYSSDALALASEAWLGPAYQMTSQINVVNPGGVAQSPHRDYHLGFMTNDAAGRFPAHVHRLSPALTLQGAVAHVDMPVDSGPTKLLPHSQKYLPGYLAWREPGVMELFEARHRQYPMQLGDAMFFNPAVLHAAGSNLTPDVRRMANLLQVSSAFGRAMETVDRARMVRALHPDLQRRVAEGTPPSALAGAVACAAEGYPFPTNLDLDPPVGGLAPASQADLLWSALEAGWTTQQLAGALEAHASKRSVLG